MAEQVVELQPGESKLVPFEAIPSVVKTYQVSVDGLTGNFEVIAPPEPSALLISYQAALNEAYIHVEAGYPNDWIMIPGYGLQYAEAAIPQLEGLMIQEAITIRMITSSAEAYFVRAVMYNIDGTTIVPYWWSCPYCPEKFRSPEALTQHIQAEHSEVFNAKGTIISISPDTREEDPETGAQDNIGLIVRWRNDSPFGIRGHVDAWLGVWRPTGSLTAKSGQDAFVAPSGYAQVYFTADFHEQWVARAVLSTTIHGVRITLDEKP